MYLSLPKGNDCWGVGKAHRLQIPDPISIMYATELCTPHMSSPTAQQNQVLLVFSVQQRMLTCGNYEILSHVFSGDYTFRQLDC